MKEVWKDIPGYEGYYQVSNLGNVLRVPRFTKSKGGLVLLKKIELKQRRNKAGYMRITLTKNKTIKTFMIHRLVAEAFIANPENKPCVNHIDMNKENNCFKNLEWVTYKENWDHAMENSIINFERGERHHAAKLTKEQVLEIRKIGRSKTLEQIGEMYGVSFKTISQIINRQRWKHVN